MLSYAPELLQTCSVVPRAHCLEPGLQLPTHAAGVPAQALLAQVVGAPHSPSLPQVASCVALSQRVALGEHDPAHWNRVASPGTARQMKGQLASVLHKAFAPQRCRSLPAHF